jgi:hypothetical protein
LGASRTAGLGPDVIEERAFRFQGAAGCARHFVRPGRKVSGREISRRNKGGLVTFDSRLTVRAAGKADVEVIA